MSSRTLTAKDVAIRNGWALPTVYVNRRRSLRKLDAGAELTATDLPIGRKTRVGLRWTDVELDRFTEATNASKRRGGHRRPARATAERGT